MFTIEGLGSFLEYSDWANEELIKSASRLSDEQLDQPCDMGRGSLRLTLMHIWAGEHVWLKRWQGQTETPWPNEDVRLTPAQIGSRFREVAVERGVFLSDLTAANLNREITYRDSKGSLFRAKLSDMVTQGLVHSIHHRAQASNMIRRAGGAIVELDYMYHLRTPA